VKSEIVSLQPALSSTSSTAWGGGRRSGGALALEACRSAAVATCCVTRFARYFASVHQNEQQVGERVDAVSGGSHLGAGYGNRGQGEGESESNSWIVRGVTDGVPLPDMVSLVADVEKVMCGGALPPTFPPQHGRSISSINIGSCTEANSRLSSEEQREAAISVDHMSCLHCNSAAGEPTE
jgi:hypothetical protein